LFVLPDSSQIIALALAEDFGVAPERFGVSAPRDPRLLESDVTSFAALGLDARFSGAIVARQSCTVAGLPVIAEVYDMLSAAAGLIDPVEVFPLVAEGSRVSAGTPVAEVEGVAAAVLGGERTALDFLMQLSGIATRTAEWVAAANGRFAVCDTRKSPPGLRLLAKYAVRVGGGVNHRLGLYDMVLVKDNHIRRAGGITAAVEKARVALPDLLIEVEADSAAQAIEAVGAGADLVLLDNFDDAALPAVVASVRSAAEKAARSVLIEVSGGVTLARVPALRVSGVDRVSTSELTFGTPVIDFGLDETASGGGAA
jgi:nicotinate-nucleotide pyrophosphorylase (carboxylating)